MKYLLSAVIFFLFTASTCHNATVKTTSKNCYKARLAIKGICMNYVIQVLDGDLKKLTAQDIMTRKPKTIAPTEMAVAALDLMRKNEITQLAVVDNATYLGMVHLHDLVKEGLI